MFQRLVTHVHYEIETAQAYLATDPVWALRSVLKADGAMDFYRALVRFGDLPGLTEAEQSQWDSLEERINKVEDEAKARTSS